MVDEVTGLANFFALTFGSTSRGYVGFWYRDQESGKHFEEYFEWPRGRQDMIKRTLEMRTTHNVYFCPQLLNQQKRNKNNVESCPSIWADLDTCHPGKLLVTPTITMESSPGRFQAVWALKEAVDPTTGESYAMRIAYHHAPHGADRSGFDLSQLLRVPYTFNYKYGENSFDAPQVKVYHASTTRYSLDDFAQYPDVKGTKELLLPVPEPNTLPDGDPLDIIQRHRNRINPRVFGLFTVEPEGTWSEALWRMLMLLFEGGLAREEVYKVALSAACNKYARDGRPSSHLWRDVCRAYLRHQENINSVVTSTEQSDLISDEELRSLSGEDTFVEQYIEWASGRGDAAPQYHQASAFTILSALLAANLRIPTSFGAVLSNMWFMILGDTTLTRKSTAMDLGTDLLFEVDEDYLLATDGSIEGLLTGLSLRPGKTSLFLRDEFTGLLEQMTKKDYMAGMAETLTRLYDGKPDKRVLRKEVIHVSKPRLVILAGGIKARAQSLLTFEHVSSGFIPRFVFVTAESQVSRVRPLGPPVARDLGEREAILDRIRRIREHYTTPQEMQVLSTGAKVPKDPEWDAELTPDAWARYQRLEKQLLEDGIASEKADLMVPLYQRLSVSILKAAGLIAASRNLNDKVVVEEIDIVRAIKFGQGWRSFGNDVVNGIGRTAAERELNTVLGAIAKNPGVSRSQLMRTYHLTARQADAIFSTLEQRGLITYSVVGNARCYVPVGVE